MRRLLAFFRVRSGLFQYIQYSLIGLSCAGLDLGVLNLLLYFFPTQQSLMLGVYNTVAYSLAVLNSYIWNSKLTFRHSSKQSSRQVTAFILQAAVSLGISDALFVGGTWILGAFHTMPDWLIHNIAKILSMFISSLSSFFFNKFFVFRKKKDQDGEEDSQS